jgi:hypothetical protein
MLACVARFGTAAFAFVFAEIVGQRGRVVGRSGQVYDGEGCEYQTGNPSQRPSRAVQLL